MKLYTQNLLNTVRYDSTSSTKTKNKKFFHTLLVNYKEFVHETVLTKPSKYDSTSGTKISICLKIFGGMMLWIGTSTFKGDKSHGEVLSMLYFKRRQSPFLVCQSRSQLESSPLFHIAIPTKCVFTHRASKNREKQLRHSFDAMCEADQEQCDVYSLRPWPCIAQ